jgi:hypothetical protein|tara:strand:+ start:274 stop:657 length:384 start_codon:yes stop_codon:yes gene_type:complete
MKLSEYLNSINYTKDDVFLEDPEYATKSYVPYVINRCLSYFPDTILHSNEMNSKSFLDNKMQYDYYRFSLRKRKRFSKWLKEEKSNDLQLVKEYFNYSNRQAKEALRILSQDDLKEIRIFLDVGGVK